MKELFPGYYRKSKEEINHIWDDARFVVDANVLLNIYRYSDQTGKSLYESLEVFKDKLWLPYHCAVEFHRNRLNVIHSQTKTYSDLSQKINSLIECLEDDRQHPFVSSNILQQFKAAATLTIAELDDNAKARAQLLNTDPHLDKITELFGKNVGDRPTDAVYRERNEAAKDRVQRGVPPGFRDQNKTEGRQHGDALIWLEVLAYAKNSSCDVIIITDDAKDDWWLEVGGQTIGPHPELVKEFADVVSKQVLIYRPAQFVEHAGKRKNKPVARAVIDEMESRSTAWRDVLDQFWRRLPDPGAPSGGEEVRRSSLIQAVAANIDALRQLNAVLRNIPHAQWRSIPSALLVPLDVRMSVESLVRRSPQLCTLIKDISSMGDAEFHNTISSLANSDESIRSVVVKCIVDTRNLTKESVHFVLTLI